MVVTPYLDGGVTKATENFSDGSLVSQMRFELDSCRIQAFLVGAAFWVLTVVLLQTCILNDNVWYSSFKIQTTVSLMSFRSIMAYISANRFLFILEYEIPTPP